MKTTENINLIYAFVHRNFKRITRRGKEVYWKTKNWVLIENLSDFDFSRLLILARLENQKNVKLKKVRHTVKTV